MTILQRLAAAVTMLLCAAAFAAPSPAVAGSGLSMEDAKHQALVYANELCLADSKCTDPVVGKCARLTAKKVTCKSVLERKGDHRCKYKILLKKTPEGIKGNVGEITCT